jgi:MerR family transcriptional regulator, thiopeptide resistance regulator
MGIWKIGDVAARTGLTIRTLRYYEQIGLLPPAERQPGGHRVYTSAHLDRLYRVALLRQLGTPLADIAEALDTDADLATVVGRHLADVDGRLQAMGRHREQVVALRERIEVGESADEELLTSLGAATSADPGVRQRITLLVYDDIGAAHDFLVRVFGFGPGTLSRDESGKVVHGEVHVGDGVVWMHRATDESHLASPASLGASTHCMAVMVDDVDAHHARTVAAGADVVDPPRAMAYGVREYDVLDCEGGLWSFMTPLTENSEGDDDE